MTSVNRSGTKIAESAKKTNGVRRALTEERINAYGKLDDHSRALLTNFSSAFAGCTVEWISREEADKRKEGTVPADGTTNEISAKFSHRDEKPITKRKNKKSRDAVSAHPRLFQENYK